MEVLGIRATAGQYAARRPFVMSSFERFGYSAFYFSDEVADLIG